MSLPSTLAISFRSAAGELGYATAAWLFAREVAAVAGADGVRELRDAFGREYPVLDTVCGLWLEGRTPTLPDPRACITALDGCERITVVGLETDALDALLPLLAGRDVAVLTLAPLPADWDRVLANYAADVIALDLDAVMGRAGRASALLCLAYGGGAHGDDGALYVPPAWLRLDGSDLRSAFRARIAWNVLPTQFSVYPRWLVEVEAGSFTTVVQ